MIRVVVADDQAMVRAGFAALLGAQPDIEVVGQASDGTQAVSLAAELQPDVILMDVRMPQLDGIEATRLLVRDADGDYSPKVLMLTTFDIDDYVYSALRAGASGFLLKDALPDELVAAVRTIATGEALLAPSVTRILIDAFAQTTGPRRSTQVEELTARETDVLLLVAGGLSNSEIAAELFIAEQTVKTHVSRILFKLGARDRVHAVIHAYDTGLVGR